MPLTLFDIAWEVVHRITLQTLESMWEFVERADINLWGEQQPTDFRKVTFLLALYKDLKGIGYQKLLKDVSDLDMPYSYNSFKHNVQAMRSVTAKWGESTIKRGNSRHWD